MKVAIYIRVSTADQNNELQRRELQDYAECHGWGIAQVYEDTLSGAKAKSTVTLEELSGRRWGLPPN